MSLFLCPVNVVVREVIGAGERVVKGGIIESHELD